MIDLRVIPGDSEFVSAAVVIIVDDVHQGAGGQGGEAMRHAFGNEETEQIILTHVDRGGL